LTGFRSAGPKPCTYCRRLCCCVLVGRWSVSRDG